MQNQYPGRGTYQGSNEHSRIESGAIFVRPTKYVRDNRWPIKSDPVEVDSRQGQF